MLHMVTSHGEITLEFVGFSFSYFTFSLSFCMTFHSCFGVLTIMQATRKWYHGEKLISTSLHLDLQFSTHGKIILLRRSINYIL